MDPSLFIVIATFALGFTVGYAVRESISHYHHAKAKRSRKFFDDSPVKTFEEIPLGMFSEAPVRAGDDISVGGKQPPARRGKRKLTA